MRMQLFRSILVAFVLLVLSGAAEDSCDDKEETESWTVVGKSGGTNTPVLLIVSRMD